MLTFEKLASGGSPSLRALRPKARTAHKLESTFEKVDSKETAATPCFLIYNPRILCLLV